MSLADTWTRDDDGNPIDWTQPPYKVGGVLNLILPGEDHRDSGMESEISKRLFEYCLIVRKRRRQAAKARAVRR